MNKSVSPSSENQYWKAYDNRYQTMHQQGLSWSSNTATPIVLETIEKLGLQRDVPILEIGCGEGRDAMAVLNAGYNLTATDVSPEAITYCRRLSSAYASKFTTADAVTDTPAARYDFIYSVAVIHMLTEDADRAAFYRYVRDSLSENGHALICTMGDGTMERKTDATKAFDSIERQYGNTTVQVAATTCRMVTTETFHAELATSGLKIVETGLTESMPDFNCLMYAVVRA